MIIFKYGIMIIFKQILGWNFFKYGIIGRFFFLKWDHDHFQANIGMEFFCKYGIMIIFGIEFHLSIYNIVTILYLCLHKRISSSLRVLFFKIPCSSTLKVI